jgi:hypothetical protein
MNAGEPTEEKVKIKVEAIRLMVLFYDVSSQVSQLFMAIVESQL